MFYSFHSLLYIIFSTSLFICKFSKNNRPPTAKDLIFFISAPACGLLFSAILFTVNGFVLGSPVLQAYNACELEEKKKEQPITNQKELEAFVKENEEIAEDLQISMDRSLMQSKKEQTKSRPAQIVSKSVSMLMDVDTRILDKLSDGEKEKLQSQLHKLTDAVALIQSEVSAEAVPQAEKQEEKRIRCL